jgi:hypothetical protein
LTSSKLQLATTLVPRLGEALGRDLRGEALPLVREAPARGAAVMASISAQATMYGSGPPSDAR